jgi:short-subunit dehydrogenase
MMQPERPADRSRPKFCRASTATKAFVLTFSQTLQVELCARSAYVQAVLPAATRTEIWARSGRDVNA